MIITLQNPTTDGLEKTYLQQSYNFATTTITVKNNQQFSANQRIQLGESGLAYTEVVTTGTPAADGITMPISATLYAHEADTPVYLLQFDQAKLYRSTNGIDGNYVLMANCPFNLDVTSEDLETTYNDNSTQSGYYYEWTVFNSLSSVESAFSDPIPAITGWARNQAGYLIEQMYEELSDANEENLTRDEMLGYINECNDDILANTTKPLNFLRKRTVINRVAGANTVNWPVDSSGNNAMWKFDHMDYNYIDDTTTPVINTTYTVTIVDFLYFRNRWINNYSTLATPTNLTATIVAGGSLIAGTGYYYVATAVYNQGGETPASLYATTIPTSGFQTIDLSWSGLPNVAYYNIYRGTFSGGETLLVGVPSSQTTYADNGSVTPGAQYPPVTNSLNDDVIQEMALNETEQQFDYYPASQTSGSGVFYLYYWGFFNQIESEGDYLQTPTPKIYKHYISYKYYLKKAVTNPDYVVVYKQHQQDYVFERARMKGQDRRDVGTSRRFGNQGWVYRSFQR